MSKFKLVSTPLFVNLLIQPPLPPLSNTVKATWIEFVVVVALFLSSFFFILPIMSTPTPSKWTTCPYPLMLTGLEFHIILSDFFLRLQPQC